MSGTPFQGILASLLIAAGTAFFLATGTAKTQDHSFEDPLFRRCIDWMMSGTGGALIDNRCRDDYGIPPPSLFLCARKVLVGFPSTNDREGCALIFDEQARKIRAGYIK